MREQTETELVIRIPYIDDQLIKQIINIIQNNSNSHVEHFIETSLDDSNFYELTINNIQSKKIIHQIWIKQLFNLLPQTIKQKLDFNKLHLSVNSSLTKLYILTDTQFQIIFNTY